MKPYNRGAVATTAEGGSRKRDAVATGVSLYNTYSARPELPPSAYKGYRQLIVKDNSNSSDDLTILRVARFLCELMQMTMTDHYYFENGSQNKRHIHSLVRAPKLYDLKETTQRFRSQSRLSFELIRDVMLTPRISKPFIEIHYIDLSSFTFEIELFTSNEHIFYCIEDYWMKEQQYVHKGCSDTPFVDSDESDSYDFTTSYIRALECL